MSTESNTTTLVNGYPAGTLGSVTGGVKRITHDGTPTGRFSHYLATDTLGPIAIRGDSPTLAQLIERQRSGIVTVIAQPEKVIEPPVVIYYDLKCARYAWGAHRCPGCGWKLGNRAPVLTDRGVRNIYQCTSCGKHSV